MPAAKRLLGFISSGLKGPESEITFGIELEVLIVCPPDAFAADLTADYKECPITMICTLLSKAGIRTTKCQGGSLHDKTYATWHLGVDESVELTKEESSHFPDDYTTWQVELASRKLALADADWQAEITTVINCITQLRRYG